MQKTARPGALSRCRTGGSVAKLRSDSPLSVLRRQADRATGDAGGTGPGGAVHQGHRTGRPEDQQSQKLCPAATHSNGDLRSVPGRTITDDESVDRSALALAQGISPILATAFVRSQLSLRLYQVEQELLGAGSRLAAKAARKKKQKLRNYRRARQKTAELKEEATSIADLLPGYDKKR